MQNQIEWEQQFNGKQNGIDSVRAIAIDANEFIYVTGKSWNGLNYDIVTLKYDSAGNSYWTAVYNDLNIGNDEPTGIVIDTAFKIVINAVSYNDSVTVYKQIYYSQCDTNCVPTFRVKQLKTEEHNFFVVKIQPNPAKDVCTIQVRSNSLDDVFKLEIYDLTGKKIFDNNISTHFDLNVAKFRRGVYQAVVSNKEGKLKKQRLVLQ